MAGRGIVVIGASAGGVQVLENIVGGLASDLPAAVFVVLHTWIKWPSVLPAILARSGPLSAEHARHVAAIRRGMIYVAPPDCDLPVERGVMRLDCKASQRKHRPSIDILFQSAARAYNAGVVGVLLSGSDNDGSAGMLEIYQSGGATIVQDPLDSQFTQMPRSAIRNGSAGHILKIANISGCIGQLVLGGEAAA